MTFGLFSRKAGLAALLAATMIPVAAHAGDQTRAEAAIAEAKGKIDAGEKVGVGNQAPELQAQARDALRGAQDLLANHKKREAIAAANHASELADQAIVSASRHRAETAQIRQEDARGAAMSAQQSAATANMRADSAQSATMMANQRADSAQSATMMANQRADTAERATAAANAQADAIRNAPHEPVTTTVAVRHDETVAGPVATPPHSIRHRVVRKRAHHAAAKPAAKTDTTVITTTTHP